MTARTRAASGLVAIVLASIVAGCGDDDGCCYVDTPAPTRIVFGTEGNRLHAYDLRRGREQVVVASHADDPDDGRDVNGQICFAPDRSGLFVVGEDTGQPERPQGWGVFQLRGENVGNLSADQVGKLVPTYRTQGNNAEPYGCAFLPDGRLLTTDVGDQASGPPTGQLIIWFPPLTAEQPRYCKLDQGIGTAGGIFIGSAGDIYVASNRVQPGILRYTGDLPTSDVPSGGCDAVADDGSPLSTTLVRERFVTGGGALATPSGVVQSPHGTFYVSSVINGAIVEYDAEGSFLRTIVRPPQGQQTPFETGTPFGLAIDSAGTLYYADLGVVIDGLEIGPRDGLGSFRRVRFQNGEPLPPEVIASGLDFPDGIAVRERSVFDP